MKHIAIHQGTVQEVMAMSVLTLCPTVLSTLPLFQGLAPAELPQLTGLLHPTTVPADTTIITVDQPGEVAYLVLAGTLKVHVEQTDGSNVILSLLGPGELVGEMSLVECCRRSATVVTLEQTNLGWIDGAAFETCLRTMPTLTYNLARLLSRRLHQAATHIQALATLDVFGRVACQLLAFAQEYGRAAPGDGTLIPLRLTQSDLAEMVGASRMRDNWVLCFYKDQHYLAFCPNSRITITNPAALARCCQ
jgi:CRP/FNR family cyclic AMP-dependent transcriptional regulator